MVSGIHGYKHYASSSSSLSRGKSSVTSANHSRNFAIDYEAIYSPQADRKYNLALGLPVDAARYVSRMPISLEPAPDYPGYTPKEPLEPAPDYPGYMPKEPLECAPDYLGYIPEEPLEPAPDYPTKTWHHVSVK